jgi:hypothetical protein
MLGALLSSLLVEAAPAAQASSPSSSSSSPLPAPRAAPPPDTDAFAQRVASFHEALSSRSPLATLEARQHYED